jgi:Fe-S-cluster containining protein
MTKRKDKTTGGKSPAKKTAKLKQNAENRHLELNAVRSRATFPEDELKHPWLGLLLEAYAITDQGVTEGIRLRQEQADALACHKGCAACCRSHLTIPTYPLELVAITWFVTEKMQEPQRDRLKQQLRNFEKGQACPLLIDNACSVHPVRPMACRQFNVFGRVCEEGEDAFYSRRQDVLTPLREYIDLAFFTMLPFYGIEDDNARREAIAKGLIHKNVTTIQDCNWSSLADRMDAFDAR